MKQEARNKDFQISLAPVNFFFSSSRLIPLADMVPFNLILLHYCLAKVIYCGLSLAVEENYVTKFEAKLSRIKNDGYIAGNFLSTVCFALAYIIEYISGIISSSLVDIFYF